MWINDSSIDNIVRTPFNSSVVIRPIDMDNIPNGFDTIFRNFTNYTQEISTIKIFPMVVPTTPYPPIEWGYGATPPPDAPGGYGLFSTTRGVATYTVQEVPKLRYIYGRYFEYRRNYFNLGEFYIERKFNNFCDYNGYTKIKMFIPFVGYVDIDVNECLNKYLQVRMRVDYRSGEAIFIIGVSNNTINNTSIYADVDVDNENIRVTNMFTSNIGIDVPVGSSAWGDVQRNMLMGAVKTAATLGFAYTMANTPSVSTIKSSNTETYKAVSQKTGRLSTRYKTTEDVEKTVEHSTPATKIRGQQSAFNNSLDALNFSGNGGHSDRPSNSLLMTLMSYYVHVIIYRPKLQDVDYDYGHLYGYPLGDTRRLNQLAGYTELSNVHVEGSGFSNCTQEEMSMIVDALGEGFII